MKGHAAMSGTPEPADARRALLAKYMRGELPQGALAAGGSIVRRPVRVTPSCAPDARVRLVPVQTSGSRRPIFYVHVHIEGGAFYCFTLARDLGSDQPLYVLEPYRFDGLRIPPTLEAMAATYIESLRSVQPEGPYLLVAFCGGSPIAFEMAQQLREDWLGIYIWVESQYRPRPYPGKVTCFWARDESGNRAVAWHKLARAAETEDHIIPGTHTTCRTDHLHALADHLSACLRPVPQ